MRAAELGDRVVAELAEDARVQAFRALAADAARGPAGARSIRSREPLPMNSSRNSRLSDFADRE